MAETTGKPKRRPGRPTRQEALKQALAEIGCDPSAIDPLRILAGIAADESTPATARVAACRALLGQRGQNQDSDSEVATDAARINERAIARMRAN